MGIVAVPAAGFRTCLKSCCQLTRVNASNSHFENLKCEFRTLKGAKLTFQVQC
jgi:hypothetical protein